MHVCVGLNYTYKGCLSTFLCSCESILDRENFVLAGPHGDPSQLIVGLAVVMSIKGVTRSILCSQKQPKPLCVCVCVCVCVCIYIFLCMGVYDCVWRYKRVNRTFKPQWNCLEVPSFADSGPLSKDVVVCDCACVCLFVSEQPQRSSVFELCCSGCICDTYACIWWCACTHEGVLKAESIPLTCINTCVYASVKHLTNYTGKCDIAESTMYLKRKKKIQVSVFVPLLYSPLASKLH